MTSKGITFFTLLGLLGAQAGHAHPKGLYDTQQQAAQRAAELGCTGTHQSGGKWMPCADEAVLHQHLRHH